MRFAFTVLFIVVAPLGNVAASKRITLVGTVVAYNQVLNLAQITSAPNVAAFIVRTRATNREPMRLIQVNYAYWISNKSTGESPDELFTHGRSWRFALTKATGCAALVEDMRGTDVNTGKEIGERLPIWKLLPGAENEKLPYGETLPCYSLQSGDYKPYSK